MKFKPGQSGNPTGRTPSEVARAPLREAITKGLPAVITKLQSLAENGSTEAARLLLDRGLPAFKPTAADVSLPAITSATTHTDAARAVILAIAAGQVAPDVGAQLITALGAAARVAETDELAARIAALESKGFA